ncbi:MAG: NAD-dependent deacylase, partial [Opitutae bacterium]|nr:NAD-dependent deacylase [Opitutae bacterium]
MDIPPELLGLLAKARRVTVLTGSGVSAESGVPTFRAA